MTGLMIYLTIAPLVTAAICVGGMLWWASRLK
jgi:hypothetical protein